MTGREVVWVNYEGIWVERQIMGRGHLIGCYKDHMRRVYLDPFWPEDRILGYHTKGFHNSSDFQHIVDGTIVCDDGPHPFRFGARLSPAVAQDIVNEIGRRFPDYVIDRPGTPPGR